MKKNKVIKIIAIIILVIVILIGIVSGIIYFYINNKLNKINKVDVDLNNITINEEVKEKLTGYRNIALFGIDTRSDDYGLGNRSDCIIIASINNDTKEVKLASVYRDSYLEIPNRGLDKVTHAYSFGGAELALSTLNSNLDLNMTEFITVNFDAVAEIVNSLGGVEIDITPEEVGYLKSYTYATAQSTGIASSVITEAGRHNLDGVQAVAYSRIRYTAGGDYKRTERMRTVLTAIVEKAKTKNISELNKLMDTLLPRIYTNIDKSEILSLLPEAMSYSITDSIGWPYEVDGGKISGIWYGVPSNLENNVSRLHQELFPNENYEPSQKVKDISQKIINKTGRN